MWARAFDDEFVKYGVDVVFTGHIHAYERFYINGIHYVNSGGGGGVPHTLDAYHDYPYATREYHEETYNYVTINGDNESIIIEAYYINGTIFDSFVIKPGVDYISHPDEGGNNFTSTSGAEKINSIRLLLKPKIVDPNSATLAPLVGSFVGLFRYCR